MSYTDSNSAGIKCLFNNKKHMVKCIWNKVNNGEQACFLIVVLRFINLGILSILQRREQTDSGAHPASYPMDIRGSFPGVKGQRREANHLPPSCAEVKECVELYLHSAIRHHGVVLS
jgi:hypothetical protein